MPLATIAVLQREVRELRERLHREEKETRELKEALEKSGILTWAQKEAQSKKER